jgi:hypothetical protein
MRSGPIVQGSKHSIVEPPLLPGWQVPGVGQSASVVHVFVQ